MFFYETSCGKRIECSPIDVEGLKIVYEDIKSYPSKYTFNNELTFEDFLEYHSRGLTGNFFAVKNDNADILFVFSAMSVIGDRVNCSIYYNGNKNILFIYSFVYSFFMRFFPELNAIIFTTDTKSIINVSLKRYNARILDKNGDMFTLLIYLNRNLPIGKVLDIRLNE